MFKCSYRFDIDNIKGGSQGLQISWDFSWWRHEMGTISALLALCEGNSPVTGEFPSQRPVTRSFDVFFDLRLNKRLCKQSRPQWFRAASSSLWRHFNVLGFDVVWNKRFVRLRNAPQGLAPYYYVYTMSTPTTAHSFCYALFYCGFIMNSSRIDVA